MACLLSYIKRVKYFYHIYHTFCSCDIDLEWIVDPLRNLTCLINKK